MKYCDHEWGDPLCTCNLENMIEERIQREKVQKYFGWDLNTVEARREYYSNASVYSLTNALVLLVEKYEETMEELKWFCLYELGEDGYEVPREQARRRAWNTLKRLGADDPRRALYGVDESE